MVGKYLEEPNNTFKDLGMLIYADSKEEDWE
jgi:hypothetical protein